jgi:tetratricopeptide (TPR) repeat protein
LNNLGWYLYRKGEYAKAFRWFERAATIKDFAPIPQERESALVAENMMLVYVALNMAKEADEPSGDFVPPTSMPIINCPIDCRLLSPNLYSYFARPHMAKPTT